MTIASAVMNRFRLNNLKPPEHLAIVPEKGDDGQQNQSIIALKFLAGQPKEYDVEIITCESEGGEKKIGDYSLDRYIKEIHRGIEVHGCYFYGCKKCYPLDITPLAQC